MRDGFIRKKVQKVVSKTGVHSRYVALQGSLTEVIRGLCKNF